MNIRMRLYLRRISCRMFPAKRIYRLLIPTLLCYVVPMCWVAIPARAANNWSIFLLPGAGPSARYGAERLQLALLETGRPATLQVGREFSKGPAVVIGPATNHPLIQPTDVPNAPEGFLIRSVSKEPQVVAIAGSDDAGTLYGCLEPLDEIRRTGVIPAGLSSTEAPAMPLRIAGIDLTPGGFDAWRLKKPVARPYYEWFYDRGIWTRVLDTLAENRLNGLCIWSEYPFSSFVRLPEFPEDKEVSEEQLAENRALLGWLNNEARRRSIRIIWEFYAIDVSPSFNRAHAEELRGAQGLQLAERYTATCVERFLTEYPEMQLLITICKGEAPFYPSPLILMRDVIFPVLRRVGQRTGRDPIMLLRAYGIDMATIREIIPLYQPLYTMFKYNNESLASLEADPSHDALIAVSQGHLANVMCLQNLKPFRWGSPDYIRIVCQNFLKRRFYGVHFHTMWADWPYSGDRVTPKLLQVDRDWLWFAIWGRYTWNPERAKDQEDAYWTERIQRRFGMPSRAARQMLKAYVNAGWVAPNLTKQFWLGSWWEPEVLASKGLNLDIWKYDGERIVIDAGAGTDADCLAEGARLDQMVHAPGMHGFSPDFSTPPLPQPLLTIKQYADRLARGEQTLGPTPVDAAIAEQEHAQTALQAARTALPLVRREREEADRFVHDLEMIKWMADFYAAKAEAAVWLRVWVAKKALFQVQDSQARERCLNALRRSLQSYRQLAKAGDRAYFSATDILGDTPYGGPIARWSDVLPKFEDEARTVEARFSSETQ